MEENKPERRHMRLPELPPKEIIEAIPYKYGIRLDWHGNYHGDSYWPHWSIVEWKYPTGTKPVETSRMGTLDQPDELGMSHWSYSPEDNAPYKEQLILVNALMTVGVFIK